MTLTSVQERTLVELMGSRDQRPVFSRDLADRLRADLERRLEPALGLAAQEPLWVTKARLADLHARCEGLFLSNHLGESEFSFSTRLAVGNLVHSAVEMSVYARDVAEPELVGRAMERLRRQDPGFGEYVAGLEPADQAEMEAEAVRQTVLFRTTFPPLEPAWTPVVELPLKSELAGGKVVLFARPDLCLGSVDLDEPMRARRLIVELKTGAPRAEHDDDLRFYALVATLRFGVPPFRVATLLLEDGRWRHHDVTEDLLESAVRRVGDGYARAAQVLGGTDPALRPGPWCSWCGRANTCPVSATR